MASVNKTLLLLAIPVLLIEHSSADLDEGLVAHWTFDEGSGTIAHDQSGMGNDAQIHGATWIVGVSGSAISFDGQNDYAQVSHSETLNAVDASVSLWLRSEDDDWANSVIEKWYGYLSAGYPYVLRLSNEHVYFACYDGSTCSQATSLEPLADGCWHHIVGLRDTDEGTVRLYVDGDLSREGEDETNDNLSNDNALYMGWRPYYGHYLNGQLDDVRVYNRVVSPTEVLQLFAHANPPFEISATSSNQQMYRSGEEVTLTVVVLSNWGESEILSLELELIASLGSVHRLAGPIFSLGIGDEYSAELTWEVPATSEPVTYGITVELTEDAGDLQKYTNRGKGTSNEVR